MAFLQGIVAALARPLRSFVCAAGLLAATAVALPAQERPSVVVGRGETLWSIVERTYGSASDDTTASRVKATCAATQAEADSLLAARYARDTRSIIHNPKTNHVLVSTRPDGIACDELEPGDTIRFPRENMADTPTIDSLSAALADISPPRSSSLPAYAALAGLGTLACGAAYLARASTPVPAKPREPPSSPLESAIRLYTGNYAHGVAKDKTVKEITKETGVSASRLYRALRERGIALRRDVADHARAYLTTKMGAAVTSGTALRDAAATYGLSYRSARRLVMQYAIA